MNILEVQDLCKTYGKGEAAVQALRHATFSVRKGEFIAIIGESGSGKSTLLNVVGALDKATSGKVWIDGQDIFSMPEKKLTVFRRQHIGFIFQSFNLIPELNVEQNITFPLLLDYKRPDQRFVNELLNVLGLTERRQNRQSYKILRGQPQRPCADCRQDAQHKRRDAKAACKGPADRRQHNADRLAAVFPLALQTVLPSGKAVGLRPAHGIARLCKGVCNAAQHRRADFAARLNGAVQHIAEVVVIVLIFGSFVVRHLVVQSVVTAL